MGKQFKFVILSCREICENLIHNSHEKCVFYNIDPAMIVFCSFVDNMSSRTKVPQRPRLIVKNIFNR